MTTLDEIIGELTGYRWVPGIGQFVDFLCTSQRAAATGNLTTDGTQTLLNLLGNPNGGPDLIEALAALAQDITTNNRALADLDPYAVESARLECKLHVLETADWAPREHTNEAAGLIAEASQHTGGRCHAMTEEERKELSKKVAEENKRSANRPR